MRVLAPIIIIILLSAAACTQVDYNDVFVSQVIDGDTLILADGEHVRLIGIDSPEMYDSDKLRRDAEKSARDIKTIQKMGREAYRFTKKIAEGKHVKLDFDMEKRDKYGRLLAYVYVKNFPEDIFLNAEIIRQGHALPMAVAPNVKYTDLFLEIYQQARQTKRGLWK